MLALLSALSIAMDRSCVREFMTKSHEEGHLVSWWETQQWPLLVSLCMRNDNDNLTLMPNFEKSAMVR